jgi:TPP-dependent 2-oxoacid decarboxylase
MSKGNPGFEKLSNTNSNFLFLKGKTTVGEYLLTRLKQLNVGHLFGVPGDFVLPFNQCIEQKNDLKFIGTCNELNAGNTKYIVQHGSTQIDLFCSYLAYAADAYARLRGLGVIVVTYSVGELSALNGVAGSYAERVPVVVITGMFSIQSKRRIAKLSGSDFAWLCKIILKPFIDKL